MSLRHTRDLSTGSIPRHLITMAIPMIWGIFSVVSMQLADVYFIGQLGHDPLTAISFTFPVSMVVFNLVMGLSIATSSITARLIGQGDADGMRHFIAHAMMIAVATGIVLAIVGTFLLDPIFRLLGARDIHLPYIRSFMLISLWGYMFITVPLVGNSALRATGDTVTPSLIMMGTAAFNIPLSYALVFGVGPFPALGVAGAATANVISNMLAAATGLYVLVIRRRILDRTCLSLAHFGASAKRLMTIAIPVGLTNLIQPLVTAFLTALLAASGPEAVAAYGIVGRMDGMAAVVLMAIAVGMAPIIGQNFGAKKPDRVEAALAYGISFSLVWSFLMAILFMLFGPSIARAFTQEPQTIWIVASYFLLVGPSVALANILAVWSSAWNAMGNPRMSVTLTLGRAVLGIAIPAYIGAQVDGWYGLFIGLMIGNMLSGLLLHFYSHRVLAQKIATLASKTAA